MYNEHIGLLKNSTVRVTVAERKGTGFFVAPRLVVTCHHVVGNLEQGEQVVLCWGQRELQATIQKTVVPRDLVLLQLVEAVPGHPCVFLGAELEIHDLLYTYGYPKNVPADSATFRFEGPSEDIDGQELLKLKQGQATPGFSGSPLLNFRTGRVCGVLFLTRDPETALGGRAIPAETVLASFDGLAELQRDYHRDHPEWKRTFFAVNPAVRDSLFSLRQALDWVASRFKPPNITDGQQVQLDFKRHIEEEIALCTLTPNEAIAEIEAWARDILLTSTSSSDLAAAKFFRSYFGEAARLSEKAGEDKVARLQRLTGEQVQISAEIEQLRLEVVGDFRRSGDACYVNSNFLDALNAYRLALAQVNKNEDPALWAAIMTDTGKAHFNLSCHLEGDQAKEHLETAAAACENALDVFTPENFPQDWALTLATLGDVRRVQAKRSTAEKVKSLFDLSVQSYEKALQVLTRERSPYHWGATQSSLGITLYEQAIRSPPGVSRVLLGRAVDTIRNALLAFPMGSVGWASTQNLLGNTYLHFAMLNAGSDASELYDLALGAFRQSLTVFTRERFPKQWAMARHNVGNVLKERVTRHSGEDASDCALLVEAANAFKDALEIRTRDRFPLDWAKTKTNLGPVLQTQAKRCCRSEQNAKFIEAQEAYREALEVYTRSNFPQDWAQTQNNLAYCFAEQAAYSSGDVTPLLDRAIEGYRQALEVFSERDFPGFYQVIIISLQEAERNRTLLKRKQ